MFALTLAFGASVAWGSADFLAGVGCRRVALLSVLLISQVVGLLLLTPTIPELIGSTPQGSHLLLGALAGFFNTVALAAFYRGLAGGTMGIVAPIAATDAFIPVGWGLLTGERLSALTLVGIALALIGVVLASRPQEAHEEEPGVKRDSAAMGVALALVAATCFGCFTIALAGASDGGTLWAVTSSRLTSVTMLAGAALVMRPKLRISRPDVAPITAIGALDVGANLLFAVALSSGLLSIIGVLGSFYPVITILLAALVLRERLGVMQRFGAASALLGAAIIAAG